jgi:hypothetical protein
MLTRAVRRVVCVVAISLTATAGVAAAPAGAVAKTRVTFTAIAGWQIDGPTASNVSLQVTETGGVAPVLFFFVSQQFCDTANDQEVFRSFNASQPASAVRFDIEPNLSSAVLGARHVPMTGSEQRIDGCTTATSSAGASTTSLGTFEVSILARWTATAPKVDAAPGIRTRDGVALAFELSPGPLDLGFLGQSQFAQLRRTKVPTP